MGAALEKQSQTEIPFYRRYYNPPVTAYIRVSFVLNDERLASFLPVIKNQLTIKAPVANFAAPATRRYTALALLHLTNEKTLPLYPFCPAWLITDTAGGYAVYQRSKLVRH